VGASPTQQPLQPEATGAGMEETKCLKPSDSGSPKGAYYLLAFRDQDDEALVEGPAVPAIQQPTPELSMAAEVQP
jgi:hypothetical protein